MKKTTRHDLLVAKRATTAHTILNFAGSGYAKLQLVPLNPAANGQENQLLVINGWIPIVLGIATADLIRIWIETINAVHPEAVNGAEIDAFMMEEIAKATVQRMGEYYQGVKSTKFMKDLNEYFQIIMRLSAGETIPEIHTFADQNLAMRLMAPLRADLGIATNHGNMWANPVSCSGCLHESQPFMESGVQMPTHDWLRVIDACAAANIPQLQFTSGNATLRDDLPALVHYAKRFHTILSTSGKGLTLRLARQLVLAQLDGLKVSIHAENADVHDALTKEVGSWNTAVQAVKAAITAKLPVTVNVTVGTDNLNLAATFSFLQSLRVQFVDLSVVTTGPFALNNKDLFELLNKVIPFARMHGLEVMMTTPDALTHSQLDELNLPIPQCSAATTTMLIAPSGYVLPGEGWRGQILGHMLENTWDQIWYHPTMVQLRSTVFIGCACNGKKAVQS